MRALKTMILLATALSATTALAASDVELFEKKVQTVTVPGLEVMNKAKALCVCINDPNNWWNIGAAGVLKADTAFHTSGPTPPFPSPPGRVYVTCAVMMAEANGEINSAAACPEWVPLTK